MSLKTVIKDELVARKKFLIATEQSDELRTEIAAREHQATQEALHAARRPFEPLQKSLGGEIVPPPYRGMPGLENALKSPDALDVEATIQRAELADKAGVFDLALQTSESVHAQTAIEQMACHQMAAAHKRCLELIADSSTTKNSDLAIKKARTAARLMDAFSRSALTLQRLQHGVGQTIQVQHIQITASAMVGQGEVNQNLQNPPVSEIRKTKGGRPPTTGYRTREAIAERQADKELLVAMNQITTA